MENTPSVFVDAYDMWFSMNCSVQQTRQQDRFSCLIEHKTKHTQKKQLHDFNVPCNLFNRLYLILKVVTKTKGLVVPFMANRAWCLNCYCVSRDQYVKMKINSLISQTAMYYNLWKQHLIVLRNICGRNMQAGRQSYLVLINPPTYDVITLFIVSIL